MKKIARQKIKLPRLAPVMVLPEALLFPNALLPLFIFEPRYRAMLEWALEHDRMFCIALMKPGIEEARSDDDFYHVAGLGMVRACVEREDGTSHLILQGLARVRFDGFVKQKPFRIAELSEVASEAVSGGDGETLSAQVLELCAEHRAHGMPVPDQLDEQLAQVGDPALLCDLVAHTFVRDPHRRQQVLEEERVAERLRRLIAHLRAELS